MFYLYEFGDYPARFRWDYDRFFYERWCREASDALQTHSARTMVPEEADFFIISATLRCVPFAKLEPDAIRAMCRDLRHLGCGRKHLAFDLRDDPRPLFQGQDMIVCKSAFHRDYYRPESGISIPQFPRYHFTQPFLPATQRKYLASFKGNVRANCGGLRRRLLSLHDENVFPIESAVFMPCDVAISEAQIATERVRPGQSSYVDMLYNSTFALLPRGCGYALSYRMIESLNAGCVPVIISDGYVLPFERLLDYSRFSLRVPEADIAELPDILREHRRDADRLQAQAYSVYAEYFSTTARIIDTIVGLASKVVIGAETTDTAT